MRKQAWQQESEDFIMLAKRVDSVFFKKMPEMISLRDSLNFDFLTCGGFEQADPDINFISDILKSGQMYLS